MNNIHQINNYHQLPSIRGQGAGKIRGGRDPSPPAAPPGGTAGDRVQISEAGAFLGKISELPEIRADKVETIRQALAGGTYDIKGKLSIALDKLLDEYAV